MCYSTFGCFCGILIYDSFFIFFFFSSRRRHTRLQGDWSSDVCSSDLEHFAMASLPATTDNATRWEEGYVSGQWRHGEVFFGILDRNWGPSGIQGVLL